VVQKWTAWLKSLADQGYLVDRGHPLERSGKVIDGGKVITDGPFAEAKDLVGGFSLVKARDVSQAAQLALGCPILERGGQVEVRPVMKLDA
jgi:hypothetical protein